MPPPMPERPLPDLYTGPSRFAISYTAPMDPAWAWMKQVLGRFDATRWLTFCVGGYLSIYLNANLSIQGDPNNMPLLLVSTLFSAVLTLLGFAWLNARGAFVFLDNMLTGVPAVSEPWSRTAKMGNSYFLYQLAMASIAGGLLAKAQFDAVVGMNTKMAGWQTGAGPQPDEIFAVFREIFSDLGGLVYLGICVGIFFWLVNSMVHDLVVPVMYRRRLTFLQAAKPVAALVGNNLGIFAGYFLFRLIVEVAVLFLSGLIICVLMPLCCVSLIPVVGFLPVLWLWGWRRLYTVMFLEQFGPEWEIFDRSTTASFNPNQPLTTPYPGMPG